MREAQKWGIPWPSQQTFSLVWSLLWLMFLSLFASLLKNMALNRFPRVFCKRRLQIKSRREERFGASKSQHATVASVQRRVELSSSGSEESTTSQSYGRSSSYTPARDSSSASSISSSCREQERHSPLKPSDPTLLRMSPFNIVSYRLAIAEILCKSIEAPDEFFTPSPDIESDNLLSYDYSEQECTVIAVYQLLKRASLPIDTFILAALILRRLTPEFYDEWYHLLTDYQPLYHKRPRSKEIIIMAAIVSISIICPN